MINLCHRLLHDLLLNFRLKNLIIEGNGVEKGFYRHHNNYYTYSN